jgi:hypothetical protein
MKQWKKAFLWPCYSVALQSFDLCVIMIMMMMKIQIKYMYLNSISFIDFVLSCKGTFKNKPFHNSTNEVRFIQKNSYLIHSQLTNIRLSYNNLQEGKTWHKSTHHSSFTVGDPSNSQIYNDVIRCYINSEHAATIK